MDNLDLNKAWKKINEEKFLSSTIKKEEIMNAISKESSLTISGLKKGLKYKLYWTIFFVSVFAGGMLWNLNNPELLGLFSVFFILYAFGISGLYSEYKKMDGHIDVSKDTLSEMKKHREIMKRALRNEERWGYIAFPIIIIAMLLLPKLMDKVPIIDIVSDLKFMGILIGCLIGLTTLGMWLTKKMNKSAYGCFIEDLEDSIKKMEEL